MFTLPADAIARLAMLEQITKSDTSTKRESESNNTRSSAIAVRSFPQDNPDGVDDSGNVAEQCQQDVESKM